MDAHGRGREAEVQALYERLAGDERHRDVRLLDRREIGEPSFGDWAMKHVPNAPEVQQLLAQGCRCQPTLRLRHWAKCLPAISGGIKAM